MTNKDLDLAREWAEFHAHTELVIEGAAARVIQSLPDQWIDAEKVREILAEQYMKREGNDTKWINAATIESLLTPSLPTLADMTPEERAACQWMQAEVLEHESWCDGNGAIIYIHEHGARPWARVIDHHGRCWEEVPFSHIVPHPDMPRLKWPNSGDSPTVAEQENVAPDQAVAKDICNNEDGPPPHPEDAPAGAPQRGEAWLVMLANGQEMEAIHIGNEIWPWVTLGADPHGKPTVAGPSAVPISRLVPEVTP